MFHLLTKCFLYYLFYLVLPVSMASRFSNSQWEWPAGMDAREGASSSSAEMPQQDSEDDLNASNPHKPQPAQERRRHYEPRTCRICFEVVQPTTELDDSIAAGIFTSKARVRYVSEDPELGRLISPCLCKGSQRYVHEGCLQAWRQSSPLSDRNFWRCPTCQFEYRLSRLRYGRWLSSKPLRGLITLCVLMLTVFLMGFIADPIINFWIDPFGSIAETISDVLNDIEAIHPVQHDDEPDTWWFHFTKGFLSLGLVGFLKTLLAMSPWHWFNLRSVGGRRRAGRDRMESINLALVMVGIITFLGVSPAQHSPETLVNSWGSGYVEIGEPS